MDNSFTLRFAQTKDYDTLTEIHQDLELQRSLLAPPGPAGPEDAQSWMQRIAGDCSKVFLVIAKANDDSCIGYVQIADIDNGNGNSGKQGRMGICLARPWQGKGYGAEALRLLHEYARKQIGLSKLTLEVLTENEPARRLYERSGYRQTGILRKHFAWDNELLDVVIMELLLTP